MRERSAITDKPNPLHVRIRADIEHRIMSGALKPGDRIPFEHELMTAYGCSRMTVNKALSGLMAAGLIVRRRRAGSFVAPQRIDMAALAIPDMRTEIEARGATHGLKLLTREITIKSDGIAIGMQAAPGTRLLELLCVHLADTQPFALERRVINLAEVPPAEAIDFGTIAPGSWLLENIPWTEAENRISARKAGHDAPHLGIASSTPCLALERKTWRNDAQVTHVLQSFPSEEFSLVAKFSSTPRT
ncbi:UTRA domain-containing protein [Sphingomonas sp. 2R-10]|uniref:UTRA domain-containing protein n=1 Tax=Sphingomonas sp. 2R-10 TaxID=3045148 RepID=UPI0019CFF2C9|nr:UTRA domain-containing protein [Sphingomonas sp. 2R-10]MDJ0278056.1 UTRA domain-containing protein [Sphingomonas sp. 2R-10]